MQPAFVVSFQLDRKFKTDNQDSVVLVDFDLRHVSEYLADWQLVVVFALRAFVLF
jgi:hypothetical protein